VSQIRLRTGQQLLMSKQTIIRGISGTRPLELINATDADDIRIVGGVLDGTGQTRCRGFGIFGGRRIHIDGTRAINMAASGGAGGHGFFVGTSFTRTAEHIVFDAVSTQGNHAAGILIVSVQSVDIVDSQLADTTGTGAGIWLAPSGALDLVRDVMVRGCEIARNHYGVRASTALGNRFGAVALVGNHMDANRLRGIDALVRSDAGFLVDGNVVRGTAGDGIVVDRSSGGLRIVDNEIRDNTGTGIRLRNSQRWEVRGNHIVRQRLAGMVVHPGTPSGLGENFGVISHNQIWDNSVAVAQAESGIRVEGASGQKPQVSVVANWYGNFTTPATQRSGVMNVGPFDRTTVVLQNNRTKSHTELVNV
jgi:parallel beta-helix repeat protein